MPDSLLLCAFPPSFLEIHPSWEVFASLEFSAACRDLLWGLAPWSGHRLSAINPVTPTDILPIRLICLLLTLNKTWGCAGC